MESLQVYAGDGRAPSDFNKHDEDGNRHGYWYTGGLLPKGGRWRPEFLVESAVIKYRHGVIDGPVCVALYPLSNPLKNRQFFGFGMDITWEPERMTYPELNGWWAFHDPYGVHQGYLDRGRRDREWFTLADDERPYMQRWQVKGTPNTEAGTQTRGEKAGWTGSSLPTHLECIERSWRELGVPQDRWYDFSELPNPYDRFEGL